MRGRGRTGALLAAASIAIATVLVTAPAATASTDAIRCSAPTVLPDLGHGSSALSENHRGTVVGAVYTADGQRHAAVWRSGVLQPLFDAGYLFSGAGDVNDRGQVLGQGQKLGATTITGWIWNGRTFTELPVPAGMTLVQVRRMNQSGDVMGTVQNPDGLAFATRWDAPRYRPEILPPAPGDAGTFGHGINDRGTTAGASDLSDNTEHYPVVWNRRGHVEVLPASGPGEAWAINNAGQVIGYVALGNVMHALFWDSRHRVNDLGSPAGTDQTLPISISDNGWVVGFAYRVDAATGDSFTLGWVWRHSGALLPLPAPPGSQSSANDVREDGTIVGTIGANIELGTALHAALWRCRH